jgi:hypothetical protein
MSQAIATTDHNVIRQWAESRNGHPAVVKSTQGAQRGAGGLLRIDFGPAEDSLEEVSWDDFFATFDENELAFLYQEETASGGKSRFNKFVSRDAVDAESDAAEEEEDLDDDEDEDWDDDEDEDEDDR